MNTPEPGIRINVDVTNPGQFFACCGLLELASRLDPFALGYFESGCFVVQGKIPALLDQFFACNVSVETPLQSKNGSESSEPDEEDKVDAHRGRIYPMTLGEPFNLRLDWWNDREAQNQKLKTWTAGQRVTDLLLGHDKKAKRIPSMRDHFARAVKQDSQNWLRDALPIEAPGAFSYDSRLSRNNALDLGHTTSGILVFSPAVDVLTLIGLQRFRPLMVTQWSRNLFCTWREAIPVEIASVVTLGVIPHLIDNCFEFPIIRRDSQGRFKLFGHAQPARRPHV